MQWKTYLKLHYKLTCNSAHGKRAGGTIVLMALSLGLGGCANTVFRTGPNPIPPAVVLTVDRQIAQTAQSIHREILGLLTINQAGVHPTTQRAPTHGVLAQRITLLWSGPMAPAVHAVAELIGYHYRIEGAPPVIIPIVRINAIGERTFDVLRDIGLQAGRSAGVIIYQANQTLVVSYHEHGRAGSRTIGNPPLPVAGR